MAVEPGSVLFRIFEGVAVVVDADFLEDALVFQIDEAVTILGGSIPKQLHLGS